MAAHDCLLLFLFLLRSGIEDNRDGLNRCLPEVCKNEAIAFVVISKGGPVGQRERLFASVNEYITSYILLIMSIESMVLAWEKNNNWFGYGFVFVFST